MGKANKKLTIDQIKEYFYDRGFDVLDDEYVNANTKIKCRCHKHPDKKPQLIAYASLKYGNYRCPWCSEESGKAVRNPTDEYLADVAARYGKEYIGSYTKEQRRYIKFICPKHREVGVQEQIMNNMKKGQEGCHLCNGTNRSREEFQNEVNKINPLIKVGDDFSGSKFYVSCHCDECGHDWKTKAYNLLTGYGCPECGKVRRGLKRRLSAEDIIQRLPEDVELLDDPNELLSHDQANFKCKTCGHEWQAMLSNLIKPDPTGCPCCNSWKTEGKMVDVLREFGFNPLSQYKFEDCCDKRLLPFDAFVPEINTVFEYDGEGHYFPIPWSNSEDANISYERCQRHDKIKNAYCLAHNINIVRVPYWEKDNMKTYLANKIFQ